MKDLKFMGITFDDYVADEHGIWSNICEECAEKHNISEDILSDGEQMVCGVDGCENESRYNIDFVSYVR